MEDLLYKKQSRFSGFSKRIIIIICSVLPSAYGFSQNSASSAAATLIKDPALSAGHVGISIYEPATNTYWYNYNAEKYFVPASNTKLFTLYAGMKYLGDSLEGLERKIVNGDTIIIPTGDPTFLHKDFKDQPVWNYLRKNHPKIDIQHFFLNLGLGKGWTWDDYTSDFMVYRSSFPIYGNVYTLRYDPARKQWNNIPPSVKLKVPEGEWIQGFSATRKWDDNTVDIDRGSKKEIQVPFVPYPDYMAQLLKDTAGVASTENAYISYPDNSTVITPLPPVYSRPADSLFRPMMHNSDNFFAEQTLLMVSNKRLGYMKEAEIIDTLLKKDFGRIPQKPVWVDGSGLSRYNLFTPKDFVYILTKMKNEFGFNRLTTILPTGNEGTLKGYYIKDSGFIYAKTGSMGNHFSLSGFLLTRQHKLLVFSILINNFPGSTVPVKHAVEQFLEKIREKN